MGFWPGITENSHLRSESFTLRTAGLHLRSEDFTLRTEGLHLRSEDFTLRLEGLHLRGEDFTRRMEGVTSLVQRKGRRVIDSTPRVRLLTRFITPMELLPVTGW
jgi:hypothetical protein